MTTSTSGIELQTQRRWLADIVELVSSMRFAISMLAVIAISSTIGTVISQNEAMPNYVNKFGPFWFEIYAKFGLYTVYSAWWFLLFMLTLMTSTSLCIWRNAPKMLKDMRSWRESVREQSLQNFHHKAEWSLPADRTTAARQLSARLGFEGYKSRLFERENATLIAAKQGAANKWGYIFAHSAIVIICIGGALDSDMPIRAQKWLFGKTPFVGSGIIADIPAQHRLSVNNPTFRANTQIPEGSTSNTAIVQQQEGVLIQDLPFSIQLKKFVIEHYSTGMPKLFASEVVLHDPENGKNIEATIKVNEPLIYKGIAIYQSSFEDGGSRLKLAGYPMSGIQSASFGVQGEVGATTPLANTGGTEYTVEWSGFRAFNVENMGQNGQDLRAVNPNQSFNQKLAEGFDKQLGSAGKNANNKELKNVGPSVQYKLRDKTGQAREYNNYMQPVLVDGAYVFLTGMRESPGDPFRFLRIPADDKDSVDEWMRLRAAINNADLRKLAAQRYSQRAMPANTVDVEKMRSQLQESANRGMAIFAGNGSQAGFMAISAFLERIPPAEQEKAADIFMKILNGAMWDLWQVAREKDGLPPVELTEKHGRFLQLATNAISDGFFYGAPVYLQLREFDEVKASVLQLTRSPGKKFVYLGCLLLVLGVFSMFYIRERRLWVWLKSNPDGSTHALMALSSQRKTMDFDKEFEALRDKLAQAESSPSA
jgi:cytochrome c biogenesis protein